jgi:hypothetical protein
MIKPHVLAIAFVVSASPSAPVQPPQKPAPADDPEKALALAIKLLEAKDHVGFVKRFMPPPDLEEALEKYDINRLAKDEVGRRAERWLCEFKLVKVAKPVFNDERTQATFSAKDAAGKSIEVKFILVDGKWYLP